MKTAGLSALALVVALLLYVGSVGPVYWNWVHGGVVLRGWPTWYVPLTVLRGTLAGRWIDQYAGWAARRPYKNPRSFNFLDAIEWYHRNPSYPRP